MLLGFNEVPFTDRENRLETRCLRRDQTPSRGQNPAGHPCNKNMQAAGNLNMSWYPVRLEPIQQSFLQKTYVKLIILVGPKGKSAAAGA